MSFSAWWLAPVLVCVLASAVAGYHRRAWVARGIPCTPAVLVVAAVASAGLGVSAAAWVSVGVGVAVAGAVFYAVVAVVTDARAFLIPKELTWVSLLAGVAGAGLAWAAGDIGVLLTLPWTVWAVAAVVAGAVGGFLYRWWGLASAVVAVAWLAAMTSAGLVAAMVLVLLAGGYALLAAWGRVGFSDVRMLGVAAATLWWMPAVGVVVAAVAWAFGGLVWSRLDRRLQGRFPLAPVLWTGLAAGVAVGLLMPAGGALGLS